MSWMEEYKKKLVTADEAVKVVKSGDWVEHAFGVAGANELDAALARRVDELWDVKIRCDIGAWPHYTNEADPTGEHFSRLLHNKDKEKLSTPDIMELKAYVNLSETYIYDLKMSFSLP